MKHQLSSNRNLGLGLGLRTPHFDYILNQWPQIGFFEAISENFMDSGGYSINVLKQIAEHYPIVLHGVSLSIGSTDPLNFDYLEKLKKLSHDINPIWVSDHLCWTGVNDMNSHDLLPMPLTQESLEHVIDRVDRVQEFLQRPLVLENPSTYLTFKQSTFNEPQFLKALCDATGCKLLLDVNNVYVSCFNAQIDPYEYLDEFPYQSVVQIHLAGHQNCGTHIIDTHDREVLPQVWHLFQRVWQKTGGVSTLLEWDGNIPDFQTCVSEVQKARLYMNDALFMPEDSKALDDNESVPNPVDFILPNVMQNTINAKSNVALKK